MEHKVESLNKDRLFGMCGLDEGKMEKDVNGHVKQKHGNYSQLLKPFLRLNLCQKSHCGLQNKIISVVDKHLSSSRRLADDII